MYIVKGHTAKILSNAQILRESCRGIIALPMLRYEAIADFYSCQPANIRIKPSEDTELDIFEQIFRIRKWETNQYINSWSVYSNTRDISDAENAGIVLRHCKWDRYTDMMIIKDATMENRDTLLHNWPNLQSKYIFLSTKNISTIGNKVKEVDEIISCGITLEKRGQTVKDSLRQIEIYRQYYWGGTHLIWEASMQNTLLEERLSEFCVQFDRAISDESNKIYQMELDYLFPPDVYKDLVCGDFKE